jgi:hypothetical protein
MRLIASLVLLILVAALSGCGEGGGARLSHDEYRVALERLAFSSPAMRDAQRRFSQLAAGSVTASECPRSARRFAEDVHILIDAVARLRPPRDAEDLQPRLLAAARRTAEQLDDLADQVASGRVACGQPWNARAYGLPSTEVFQSVVDAYARRGYRLESN